MDNLIQELQASKQFPPTAAAIRAAKVIKELVVRAEIDTKARILAEQKLMAADAEIARLTQELINATKNNNNTSPVGTSDSQPSIS